ncbi:hypothetical protein NQ314_020637 [Rhamnusium bicolor]|uniref:PiggyBac transposable element-derived protein domain-containing protein n=1 Tax=Rhamnusium bicolor TaxID=1586634 RepID=A0AAV8WKH9_9CUCU|nr:hypothetical protein NQ314_020637 [Rhamnusium bicolor]
MYIKLMEEDLNIIDPYERDQQRLLKLFDDVSTDEEKDPFSDSDGEYGSDKNYEESSSEYNESMSSNDSDVPTVSKKNKRSACTIKKSSIPKKPNIQTTPDLIPEPLADNSIVSPEASPLPSPRPSTPVQSDIDSWESTTAPIPDFKFDESSNRLKINIGPESTVMELFESLFTPNILEYIVDCTNNYGKALMNTNRPKTRYSRDGKFRPVSNEEMKKFLGLCLLQGQISSKNMRRYFSYSDTLYFHPIFAYTMSCRRFEQILRVLSCSPVNSKGKK